uniref:Myosin motor domain-containing protein n=1 Tax=Esox lucius TaxID=8010 RepID=A0A6Q2ZD15_ESOLU
MISLQVKGVLKKSGHAHRKSLNDSLDGELKGFLIDEGQLHTYDDLTKVNPVTPTTVLKCLQARYRAQVFYTHAGCTLVALNPFQPIPGLYTLEVMKQYHCAPQPQESKPHIFIVAEEAYRNVQGQVDPVNQSLVVSGESGAGKTWTSRCLMKYYATVAASSSQMKSQDTVEMIERRVLDSNPIMEAFGNACTLRNSNSSRFGKYIQLQLDRSQLLVGASVQTYLLEKTRVAAQPANERNFHIFYQMTKGASVDQRKDWKIPYDQSFAWLPNAEKALEEDCFNETVEAMLHLGIDTEKQGHIFRILAGLLHLGNITFCTVADESQPCDIKEHSKDCVQDCAGLLDIPVEELQTYLRVQTLRAGNQSVLFRPCSLADCWVRRDCLAKVIYAQLFEWLVMFINDSVCAKKSTWCNFIGLLDVYGFECFQVNSLEQLCINYANEKLQQHFVAHYLKAQQEEYVSEGLEWSFVKYQDNQGCLDLLEGIPTGVFSLLNEECRLNRASDAKQFQGRLEKELSGNSSMSRDKFSKLPHFTVAHYAGKVSYQIEGMMEKNKDPVPPELIHLVQKSQNPLLHQLFADRQAEDQGARGLRQVVTVVSRFKNSLESLMKILHSTTPHYTRCIKPNPECRPLTFRKEEVILQLEACGIVETIHISAAGFPISLLTFWPNLQLELLEESRIRARSQRAFAIQCCWHRYQRRRRHARRRAAILIQAGVRSWLVRREVQRWNQAAAVLQRSWRKWRDLREEEPVMVRGWPMGLALASAPTITVSMTATGFHKMMSAMACLSAHCFRSGEYKVETNQFKQGVASIRAQPRGSIKLHYQRSPLLYADRRPDHKRDGVTGLNQILLEGI